jgi:hypothetical protein
MTLVRTLLVMLLAPVVATAQARDPIAGAWELTASKNLSTGAAIQIRTPPLHVIYADGHYVEFTANEGRQKLTAPAAELTKEQLLDRLRLQGQYGTYTVNGRTLTRHIITAAQPTNEGRQFTSEFVVEGDILVITRTTNQNEKVEDRFRRLKRAK